MADQLTLDERIKRLEEYKTFPWQITKGDRIWILELASAELEWQVEMENSNG